MKRKFSKKFISTRLKMSTCAKQTSISYFIDSLVFLNIFFIFCIDTKEQDKSLNKYSSNKKDTVESP